MPSGEGKGDKRCAGAFWNCLGTHLVESDKWKEDFLLQLKKNAILVKTFVDDNKYHIWGFYFFNRDVRGSEFSADLEMLQKPEEHLKVLNAYAKGLVSGN